MDCHWAEGHPDGPWVDVNAFDENAQILGINAPSSLLTFSVRTCWVEPKNKNTQAGNRKIYKS